MIAVETNLLVYAHRGELPAHSEAARAIDELSGSGALWSIPWPCVHEFLAVVTNPRAFRTPSTRAQAIAQVTGWRKSPSLSLLAENDAHWDALTQLLDRGDVVGPKIHDARIAAICLSHGVDELWTADRDFSRFPRLRTRNPLVAR